MFSFFFFFLKEPPPPDISPLPLHDALPISRRQDDPFGRLPAQLLQQLQHDGLLALEAERIDRIEEIHAEPLARLIGRSEEHTSELQSQSNLVCRLLLEKKNLRSIDDPDVRD